MPDNRLSIALRTIMCDKAKSTNHHYPSILKDELKKFVI